jgi:hypothetical protein
MAEIAGFRCSSSETLQFVRCVAMRARPPVEPRVEELFPNELANFINMHHELVRLAGVIDWAVFDR